MINPFGESIVVYEQAFSLDNRYYRAGFEAYPQDISSCPHLVGSLEEVLWQAGWEDARDNLEE